MKKVVMMSCISTMILVFALSVHGGNVAKKRAFTLEDVYRIKGISGLSISPDGHRLLFSMTSYDLKKGKRNSEIHLLNLKTGQQVQLTVQEKPDYHPFWSGDGRNIYFLSSRQGGTQIWEISPFGGEAKKVSDFYSGVNSPVLSEQNDKIFFTSPVFPKCMEDSDCNERMEKQLTEGQVQAHLADSLLYRHWKTYREWRYTHLFYFDLKEKKTHSVTAGKQDYPPFSMGGGNGYTLSPDGGEICIVGNHDANLASSTNSDLFTIDLKSDVFRPVNITSVNKACDGSPSYSADGRYIAYLTQSVPGYEADKFRLALYDRKSKKNEIVTQDIDNWINDFQWSRDSRFIYFTVMEKGHSSLYRIDVQTWRITEILSGHSLAEFILSPDGRKLIFTRSRVGEPYEIWQYQIGRKKSLRCLTAFNRELSQEVDIRPAEEHWVDGASDHPVHLFVVKPHGFDPKQKYPLIINIHGGPQMMWSDSYRSDWQVYPGSGYVVAFPNPHGSTGYGQDFTTAISSDWDGKVMEDIERVTDYLAGLDFVDEERMGVMGWSWGGYAVMWLEGNSSRYRALAAMMGVYDLDSMYSATEELWFPEWDLGGKPWEKTGSYFKQSPSSHVRNFKTPCLVITGERDFRVPYTQSLQFFTDLQLMKVPSRLIVFKNDGHWPDHVRSMPVYYNAHLEWFHKYLKGKPAPFDTEKLIRNQQFVEEKIEE
jgi:dipeptidyl aminopeptidase/acylaminoacyl peptidase